MAFSFFKKPPGGDDDSGKDGKGPGDGGGFNFSPEKAKKFFEQARIKQEVGSYDYALNLWLNGLRLDPNNLEALQGFFGCAAQSGLKEPTKDLRVIVDGKTPVHRTLAAWLAWALKPLDADLAVRAAVEPTAMGLIEPGAWIAPKALDVVGRAEKPRKSHYINLMKTFVTLQDFGMASQAGAGALRLDPGDVQLSNDVRDLSAMGTMSKGGYENTGQAGGFRSNIRDAEKQRQLEEQGKLVKGEAALDRAVAEARVDYNTRPTDKPTIKKYIDALIARQKPEDIEEAIQTSTKAFEQTQEVRFRVLAGQIKMKRGRALLKQLGAATAANPGDAAAKQVFTDAEQKQLALEIEELDFATKAYPTDLAQKFELGRRLRMAGRHADAIAQFQQSKNDGRYKAQSLAALAETFVTIDWTDEAIETYRQALEGHPDQTDENGMSLRYGLMAALLHRGEVSKDVASAEEAERIASSIAVQNIQFRDITARRVAAKQLVTKLKSGG